MLNQLRVQISAISQRKSYQFSFLVVFMLCMYNYLLNLQQFNGFEVTNIPHPTALLSYSATSHVANYLVQLFPFLLVIPAAFTYMTDDKTKSIYLHQIRGGRRNYYASLALAVFIMTFLCFFIPFMLELLLSLIAFPTDSIITDAGEQYYSQAWELRVNNYLYGNILGMSKIAYAVFHAVIYSATAAILALLLTAISTFRIHFKVMLFLPVYLLLFFTNQAGEQLNTPVNSKYYNYIYAYIPSSHEGTRYPLAFFIILIVLLLISLSVSYLRSREDSLV